MSQGFTSGIPIDTDGTLSANSDLLIPSQKAVKTYVDTEIAAIPTPVSSVRVLDSQYGIFCTAAVVEEIIYAYMIPAGTLDVGDIVRVFFAGYNSIAAFNNSKTYFNDANSLTGAIGIGTMQTAGIRAQTQAPFFTITGANSQVGMPSASAVTFNSAIAAPYSVGAFTSANDIWVLVSNQKSGAAITYEIASIQVVLYKAP